MPKLTRQETFDFGKAYAELQQIIDWFEREDVDLDEGLKKFERGLELVQKCRERLKAAENKVVEIKARYRADA